MASRIFSIADAVSLLEKFKCSHVDGTIGEHADQSHSDTPIAGSQAAICVHFHGRLSNEGAPRQAIFDSFALKSEFESIKGIDAEPIMEGVVSKKRMKARMIAIPSRLRSMSWYVLGNHSSQTAGNKF